MEVVRVLRVERYKDRHDGLPRVRTLREDPVAAYLTRESMIGLPSPRQFDSIRRPIGRNYRAVEDSRVLCESGDHQIGIHLCELLCRHTRAQFCEDFEPHAEAISVELLIHAWLGGAPQVKIKDTRELVGRRQHDELAAILESAALNDAVKQLRLQLRDNVFKARCVENAIEHGTAVPASCRGSFEFLHVPTSGNKRLQSLVSQVKESTKCSGGSEFATVCFYGGGHRTI